MIQLPGFLNLPLRYHLVAGAFIRIFQICYGDYHDEMYDVPYTDVDYKVFSDAARHVFHGNSPYKRHTYRYSPIFAYLLLPNMIFGKNFGKVLFSIFDILITIILKVIIEHQLRAFKNKQTVEKIAKYSSLFWLYNPLSIGISTRGNADSVSCFFIITSIFFLQTDIVKGVKKYVYSGVVLGISIHLRLYPLAFSFPMFLSLGEYNKITNVTTVKEAFISMLPNRNQMALTISCIVSLILITYIMYLLYGYEFIFETYLYHFFRRDTRHNFSIFFYYSYLTMDKLVFDIVKMLTQIIEATILFFVSLTFGCDPKTLPLGLFCQAFILVAFNSVMTSQYFIWFLSLFPLVVHNFNIETSKSVFLMFMWVVAQIAWLYYAYLLEFQCREIFILLWFKSIIFFCVNIFVLCQLIKVYTVDHGFGLLTKRKIK